MDSWSRSREVEKPKPIKIRAATAATNLINLREALFLFTTTQNKSRALDWLTDAIEVLRTVAGETRA